MSLSFVRWGQNDRRGGAGQVLNREAIADVTVEAIAFRVGLEELLVNLERHLKIQVALATTELDFEMA